MVENGAVGLMLTLAIALMVTSLKLIVVDALLGSGPKMSFIGLRWSLPEFILGSIAGGLAAKVVLKVYVADLVKQTFSIVKGSIPFKGNGGPRLLMVPVQGTIMWSSRHAEA